MSGVKFTISGVTFSGRNRYTWTSHTQRYSSRFFFTPEKPLDQRISISENAG